MSLRVLCVSTMTPFPVNRGDRNRIFNTLRLLASFSRVRLICLNRSWEPPSVFASDDLRDVETVTVDVNRLDLGWRSAAALAMAQAPLAYRFALPKVLRAVRGSIARFDPDVIFGWQISTLPILRVAGKRARVLDIVDRPTGYGEFLRAGGISPATISNVLLQFGLGRAERRAVQESDLVLINSPSQKEAMRIQFGTNKVEVLPNCVPESWMRQRWSFDATEGHKILFVGNMAYGPNRDGVIGFARSTLPLIRERIPSAEIVVAGAGSESLVELKGVPGVSLAGFVPELAGLYLGAAVVVVPVPFAGGAQYKLLEAMALGVPVVASTETAEATDFRAGAEFLVANAGRAQADAVVKLMQERDLATRLSANAIDAIRRDYTWESKRDWLRTRMLSVVAGKRSGVGR